MHQKLARIQISHRELSTKMLILLTDFLHTSFDDLIYQAEFPSVPKLANITPVFKKDDRNSLRKIIDQSAYFQTSQKPLNNACFVKFPTSWIPI